MVVDGLIYDGTDLVKGGVVSLKGSENISMLLSKGDHERGGYNKFLFIQRIWKSVVGRSGSSLSISTT